MGRHFNKILSVVCVVLVAAVFVFASLPYFFEVDQKASQYARVSYQRQNGSLMVLRKFTSNPPSGWLRLSQVPKHVWGAVVVSEDWAFFDHSGVDYLQLWRAIRDSLFYGDKLRGASTISQQLAKNLFLSHQRSLVRKVLEVRLSAALESSLTKEELLERYLNIVEWGPNVVGLRQAASYYFAKPVSSLSVKEAALLAQLLPSPIRYGETLKRGEITDYAQERVEWIQRSLEQAGFWQPMPEPDPETEQEDIWESDGEAEAEQVPVQE